MRAYTRLRPRWTTDDSDDPGVTDAIIPLWPGDGGADTTCWTLSTKLPPGQQHDGSYTKITVARLSPTANLEITSQPRFSMALYGVPSPIPFYPPVPVIGHPSILSRASC